MARAMKGRALSGQEFASSVPRRRFLLAGAAGLAVTGVGRASRTTAAPVPIRYATGGGIGPNEMETVIYLDWMKENVLKRHGRDYTVRMTFTRGTPEAAALLAAGQADMATLAFSTFATTVLKGAVTNGLTIVSDNYQDGRPGYANNTYFVRDDSPVKQVTDLRGKKVGINAFGSAVDLIMRVTLKKQGLDPKKDIQVVEVGFPNIAAAIRDGRIDAGPLILPFMATEVARGGLRPLFTGADAFGAHAVIFQVVTNDFLKANPEAVRAFLDDYVRGLKWFYDPKNRDQAIQITADFTKSPKEVLASYFMTSRDYYRDPDACVSAKLIQGPVDAMHREGFIDRAVDLSKYVDMSFLPNPCKA
jgi:ABC-type nitrate/sulfonate/bicarbonate transport system substrate-binding protein